MGREPTTLRSAIKPELMSSILMKGTILGSIGAGAILYAGVFLEVDILKQWGWLIFIFGMTFITLGLLPYRKLTRLENHPNEIMIYGNKSFLYVREGKHLFTVPFLSVEELTYHDNRDMYGIGVVLKDHPDQKVVVHDPSFNMERYRKTSQKKFECDIFLPYFTERSFNRLNRIF